MRLVAIAVFACLILSGCGEKNEPEPAPERAPEPAPIDVTETAIADAPPGVQGVEFGKYCGEEELEPFAREQNSPVIECISDSIDGGAPAWGAQVQTTVEGDPVAYVYVARSARDVVLFHDATQDKFGSGKWTAFSCNELPTAKDPFPRSCGKGVEIDNRTPPVFLEREAYKACGRLGLELSRLSYSYRAYLPALECFHRAVKNQTPAEIFARSKTEEGPVEMYFRVTEGGAIERFADATQGGTGPPAWYFQECESVNTYLKLKDCSARTELPAP